MDYINLTLLFFVVITFRKEFVRSVLELYSNIIDKLFPFKIGDIVEDKEPGYSREIVQYQILDFNKSFYFVKDLTTKPSNQGGTRFRISDHDHLYRKTAKLHYKLSNKTQLQNEIADLLK